MVAAKCSHELTVAVSEQSILCDNGLYNYKDTEKKKSVWTEITSLLSVTDEF